MILSRTNQQRAFVALVQVLSLSAWFSATAVVPSLHAEWGIGSTAAVWLTASVQVGFVAGAVSSAVVNLADRTTPQYLLAASALSAAACTAALAVFVHSLAAGIPLRFLTGMFLAGVYPVGMKLTASWSNSTDRGRSFGALLAALTLGSALPHLISGIGPLPWRMVMLSAAALTAAGGVVALTLVRPGPHLDIRMVTPSPRYAFAMFAQRDRG
jgi:MFS family permease